MSHQLHFYVDPTDTKNLEALFRAEDRDVHVLHGRSNSATPRVVPSLSFEENGVPCLQFYLVRKVDLDAVVMQHLPVEGQWAVDVPTSPVVEVTRGAFDGTVLHRGRLYFTDTHQGEGERKQKPAAFTDWANRLLRKAKKMMIRQGAEYIGPHAQSWLEQWHGRLVD
jgi:hypothetical protein